MESNEGAATKSESKIKLRLILLAMKVNLPLLWSRTFFYLTPSLEFQHRALRLSFLVQPALTLGLLTPGSIGSTTVRECSLG
jgi:hypothetical protein